MLNSVALVLPSCSETLRVQDARFAASSMRKCLRNNAVDACRHNKAALRQEDAIFIQTLNLIPDYEAISTSKIHICLLSNAHKFPLKCLASLGHVFTRSDIKEMKKAVDTISLTACVASALRANVYDEVEERLVRTLLSVADHHELLADVSAAVHRDEKLSHIFLH